MIDFDEMLCNGQFEVPQTAEHASLGLVVAQRPRDGRYLNVEALCIAAVHNLPNVIFLEEDDNGAEVFGNAHEFQIAMDTLHAPTVDEALHWINAKLGSNADAWRDRLEAAWLEYGQ